MSESLITPPKWGTAELMPLPARFNSAIRELAARRFAAMDAAWKDVVFDREFELFSRSDAEAIKREVLDSGYRFDYSATVSLESEPDKYKRPERETVNFTAGHVAEGRRLVGVGDNVIWKPETVVGKVALISTTEQVAAFLTDGVPPGTIAVVDDSGGTLTAPILEGFAGVICLGGTIRSHLGILAREYDVPTLMNCQIDGLADGDVVELEVTASPPTPEAYEKGDIRHARIWKIEG